MKNGFGSCEAKNDRVFQSQRNGIECLMRGLSLDNPRLDLGLLKQSETDFGLKLAMQNCLI